MFVCLSNGTYLLFIVSVQKFSSPDHSLTNEDWVYDLKEKEKKKNLKKCFVLKIHTLKEHFC